MAEQKVTKEAPENKTEYVEFVGTPPHGTEFYKGDVSHTISREDAKHGWDEDIPQDLVWRRGKGKNQKRFLLALEDIPENVRDLVLEEPHFKKVSL